MTKKEKLKKNIVSLKKDINHNDMLSKEPIDISKIDNAIVPIKDNTKERAILEIEILENAIEQTKDIKEKRKLEKRLRDLNILLKKALSKDLVISQIDLILNQMIKSEPKERKDLKEKIRMLLAIYNEKNLKNTFDILNIDSLDDIYSQDKGLKFTHDYKAFVYYFWNPKNLNFRIIGIRQILPLFEIIETQELFFLDKPTMSTLGKPVFWIIKGVPISQEIRFTPNYRNMSKHFTAKGYHASQIDAMVKSSLFIRIFGKQKISFKTFLLFISIFIIEFLICHIIYTTWFGL